MPIEEKEEPKEEKKDKQRPLSLKELKEKITKYIVVNYHLIIQF